MRTRDLLLLLLTLIVVGTSMSLWDRHRNLESASAVAADVLTHGGIVATYASIVRNSPKGASPLGGNSTLILVQPATVGSVEHVAGPCLLVIPQEPWVVGQVDVAAKAKAELHLERNLHAMLPSKVTILELDKSGTFRSLDNGQVNYLLLQDAVPHP